MLHKLLTTVILALFVLRQLQVAAPQELERSIGDPCSVTEVWRLLLFCQETRRNPIARNRVPAVKGLNIRAARSTWNSSVQDQRTNFGVTAVVHTLSSLSAIIPSKCTKILETTAAALEANSHRMTSEHDEAIS
ncbi:hypothetical protein DFH09DRAFT_1293757 [Mycena vulgaris]|nr:hypothetical protein DFH09DRAFT_1293757 [Mycena vulgaris]